VIPWWFYVVLGLGIFGCLVAAFVVHQLDAIRLGIPTRRQRRSWKRERGGR